MGIRHVKEKSWPLGSLIFVFLYSFYRSLDKKSILQSHKASKTDLFSTASLYKGKLIFALIKCAAFIFRERETIFP